MRRFTRLFLELDATTATGEKLAALEAYFRDAPPEDACWGLALLTGNRPKGAATTSVLRESVLEASGLPEWLLAECHAAVGDLSETIALLLPDGAGNADEPLHRTMGDRVLALVGASEDDKRRIIRDAWAVFGPAERLVYHKLIRGGFRLGVQKRLVTRALASVAGIEPDVMAHRLIGRIRPTAEAYAALMSPEQAADDAARPYPFFLAHPLEGNAAGLGAPGDWAAEWKWDGIRAQLIRRAGQTALWSRGEEPIAHQFPEIAAAAAGLLDGTVLDGEVLLWRGGRDGGPLGFAALQTRLNRKVAPTHQLDLFDETRAVLVAYDLLEQAGRDLRREPFEDRRAALEEVITALGDETIRLSPLLGASGWEELAAVQASARERGAEGLMLKHRRSVYGVGRTKPGDTPGWFKWKVDPYTVDAVLTAAQPGSGRRANLYTDYTFAVWDRTGEDAALVTFAKAYSGLEQDEIERLDRWIRSNTTAKRGPFRQVTPEQVFELGFEGLQASERHKSGIAVRFPRILRWRTDKPAAEADTLDTLRALLEAHRA
ncbi:MAG: ATP-dependent DNA ligase [Phycisphaerales bacterium]|nr:ATP-dependent DNA ligase [Planctomycetota bacterium]MCH8507738.1 ATP-dependent DNA ligase [Phycisphaerales bacterium]